MAANLGTSDPVFLTPGFFTAAIDPDNVNPFEQSFVNSAGTDEDFLNSGPRTVSGVSTPGNGFGSNAPFKPLPSPSTSNDFLEAGGQSNPFGPYFFQTVSAKPLTPPFNPLSPDDQPFGGQQRDLSSQQPAAKLDTRLNSSRTQIRNGIVTPVSARSPESRDGVSQPREQNGENQETNGATVAKKSKPSSDKVLSTTTAKTTRKRVRKPRSARFADSANRDDEKLAKFRERNRLAASKCREKKKAWTSNLETRVRELQASKESLSVLAASMKEELNYLQEELLRHGDCSFEPITRYLQKIAERSFSPTQYGIKGQSHSRNGSMVSEASFYASLTNGPEELDDTEMVDSPNSAQADPKDEPFDLPGDDAFKSLISTQLSQDDTEK